MAGSRKKILLIAIAIIVGLLTLCSALVAGIILYSKNYVGKAPMSMTSETQEVFNLREIKITTLESVREMTVDSATNSNQHELGLMYREKLNGYDGMIFIFDEAENRYFWMKNTKIKLDIIFFDGEGNFINVVRSAEPCPESLGNLCPNYVSTKPAKYVLETNSGFFNDQELNENTKILFVNE